MRDTALVTGATGFVGTHVARTLLSKGVRVKALVRPASSLANLQGLENLEIVKGDLLNPASLKGAVEKVRYVFHVAADYRIWVPDRDYMRAVNVDGTAHLLEACCRAGVERVVYTSSVAAIGKPLTGLVADERNEGKLEDMIGAYKQSKFLAESLVRAKAAEGLNVVIVNPSTPVGARDIKPTPTGKIIVDFLNRRMPATLRTGLNFVDVRDVASGHWLALKKGTRGARYILGGENLELKAFLQRLGGLVGLSFPRIRLPYPVAYLAGVLSACCAIPFRLTPLIPLDGVRMAKRMMFFDSSFAERELGYQSRPIDEALKKAVQWFSQAGYIKPKYRDRFHPLDNGDAFQPPHLASS